MIRIDDDWLGAKQSFSHTHRMLRAAVDHCTLSTQNLRHPKCPVPIIKTFLGLIRLIFPASELYGTKLIIRSRILKEDQ